MPCSAPVRGKTDAEFPPSEVIDNDPCGRQIVATSSPLLIDQSGHSLCLAHLQVKLGLGDRTLVPPYTFSP